MRNVRQRKTGSGATTNGNRKTPVKEESLHSSCLGKTVKVTGCLLVAFPLVALLYLELFVPCPIEPQAHTFDPIPALEGPLAPNHRLSAVEKLLPGKFRGPESMAIYENKLYTGVADGRIVEVDLETLETNTIVERLGVPPCGAISNEKNCGRPLGIRVKSGIIYVVDAYLGLFKIPLSTRTPELLFSASEKSPDGYAPKFLNDIEVASDGKIYMTDSSTKWGREHHPYVGFENRPDGRLMVSDPATNETRILERGLYFANGLQLARDESFILITEMSRCRVTKFYLKGAKKGQTEIFSDNLPGLPDNIRPSSRGGYWVALAVVRHPTMWSVWDTTAPYPWMKRIMAKLFHRFSIGRMVPKYGMIIELDAQGNIISSMHDQTASTFPAVSEVQEKDGVLYIGSYFLPFLGRLELRVPTGPQS